MANSQINLRNTLWKRSQKARLRDVGFKRSHPQYVPFTKITCAEVTESKWTKRLTKTDFSLAAKASPAGYWTVPDVDSRPGTSKLLRPKSDEHPELINQCLKEGSKKNELL